MGHIPRGMHPEIRLSADARLSPAMSEDTNDDEILRRRAQITVLQDRINRFRELLLPSDLHESLGRHDEHTARGSGLEGEVYIVIELVAMTMMSLRL